jgi:hypothetical protein
MDRCDLHFPGVLHAEEKCAGHVHGIAFFPLGAAVYDQYFHAKHTPVPFIIRIIPQPRRRVTIDTKKSADGQPFFY